jgi:hypothetical protein
MSKAFALAGAGLASQEPGRLIRPQDHACGALLALVSAPQSI